MAASLWIMLGGALGSLARYWAGLAALPFSRAFPWGTLLINIGGSFLIGFFAALTASELMSRMPFNENLRLFMIAGFCGGFTTFSTFSLQNLELLRGGALFRAFANMALSVALCLLACALGAAAAGKWQAVRHNATEQADSARR